MAGPPGPPASAEPVRHAPNGQAAESSFNYSGDLRRSVTAHSEAQVTMLFNKMRCLIHNTAYMLQEPSLVLFVTSRLLSGGG